MMGRQKENLFDIGIAEISGRVKYPARPPFNPPQKYPELKFCDELDLTNRVYPAVRDLFHGLELDKNNFGTKNWNPLGGIIKKGAKVVIKPNWVLDVSQYDVNALITHMSVIRAVLDYAWIACGPTGQIDILESPIQNTNWDNLMKVTGALATVSYLQKNGYNIGIQDIRTECFVEKEVVNIFGWRLKIFYRKSRPGTKKGYVHIDLGNNSAFDEVKEKADRFRSIQQWTEKDARKVHNRKNHIYSVPREILECDAFINMPKLKTHRKAGVTLALKNLVGMVNNKDWLPHYIKGTPNEGGDEAPTERQMYVRIIDALSIFHFFKRFGFSIRPPNVEKLWRRKIESDLYSLKNVRQANWHGGDTVWRMVYDLNFILFHATKDGRLSAKKQRNYFTVVDGIIGGERFGPLDSMPKESGIVIGGEDPVLIESVGALVMGFDPEKIRTLNNAKRFSKSKLAFGTGSYMKFKILSNDSKWKLLESSPAKVSLGFVPAPGWQSFIELKR